MRLGDLSLSENLFFLGHDPFTGKPRVRQDILDIGLAGAALADLVLDERVALDNGVVVLRNRYATGDPLTDRVLTMIAREAGRHGARDWVEHLRDKVFPVVTSGLADRGLVVPGETRGILRKSVTYLPADLRTASAPRARIRSAMLGRSRCDLPTATLALVAWAAGLDDIAEPDLTRRQMADWVERLKNMTIEPIARLVAGTEAAIAATVYGGNRA
ncbi:hypothetical protein GCM10029964_100990 [Kibdelosporangium lantanae]